MTRLRFVTRLNPSKTEAGELVAYGNVTFAPMDALADGLGGLDTSLERPADELADGSYSYFADGDLLLAKVTPCFENGKKALVTNLPNRIGFATSEVHVIRPDRRKVDPNYLRYLLSSEAFRAAGIASMTGAGGLRRISDNAIRDFQLPVADLATQKAIAAFLDRETARINKLIAKKERQLTLATEKFDALVSMAVTKGLDGNRREFSTSGVDYLGASPKEWDIEPLGRRYSVQLGKMLDASRQTGEHLAPYLRVADVQWDEINVEDLPLMDFSTGDRLRFNLHPGDLLVNEGGSYVGRSAIWRGQIPECFYQKALHRVRPRQSERDSAEFLLWVMWFATKQGVFVARGNQTTIDHLTAEALRRYRFAFPPAPEQRAIASRLREEHEKNKLITGSIRRSVELLREHRAALITAAVTAQVDIRDKLPAVTTKLDRAKWRVIVGAEIIHRLPSNPKRARVKVHKLTYLAEAHLGIDGLQGSYLREAAGPLDRALREETERGLEAAGYYCANQTDGTGTAVTYTPLAKAGQHKAELATLLGCRAEALRSLIAMLADLDRRATEAVTTLYAVWNDALIDGETPDDAAIIDGVLHEWHTEKGEKFTAADLTTWLAWIRRHNLIPRGQGPRTTPTMMQRLL